MPLKDSESRVDEKQKESKNDVQCLNRVGVSLKDTSDGGVMIWNVSEYSMVTEVKEKQNSYPILHQLEGQFISKKLSFLPGGYY